MDERLGREAEAGGEAAVIRSEEELVTGVRAVPYERVRVGKRIVTETVTRTIELRREELVLERVPVEGEAGAAAGEGAFADDEVDLVLLEEQVELVTRVVPRERVRVRKEIVTAERPVTATLRREQVDVDERPSA
jgi:uncharacterized protein (TIGR02271 family)